MFLSTGFSISRALLITAVFLFLFVAPAFSHAKTHEIIVENTVPEALAAYVFSYWLDETQAKQRMAILRQDDTRPVFYRNPKILRY